jgi:mRNA interferase MazF
MVMQRGDIWWADLPDAHGSGPGYTRPVLIVQSDGFNRSSIRTVIVAIITSNLRLSDSPGNVHLPRKASGLPRESVVNVSQLMTVDKSLLRDRVRRIRQSEWTQVESGLRLVLALG